MGYPNPKRYLGKTPKLSKLVRAATTFPVGHRNPTKNDSVFTRLGDAATTELVANISASIRKQTVHAGADLSFRTVRPGINLKLGSGTSRHGTSLRPAISRRHVRIRRRVGAVAVMGRVAVPAVLDKPRRPGAKP